MRKRFRSAANTLEIIYPLVERVGITRLADLSYLDDSSELYVYSAIRPNAKSISVSMGKSIVKEEAKCAALMESLETYFVEEVKPSIKNISYKELVESQSLFIDINTLAYQATISNEQKLDWCVGRTLLSNKDIYIPHVALTLDSNLLISNIIGQNSDGIASGTNYKEALIYSFLELIERTSIKNNKKKQLECVESKIFSIINKIAINYSFYIYENIFNLPVVECNILNRNPIDNQSIFAGYSCNYSKHEAVIKSISEAIQSKIGVVSGARDDLDNFCYNFTKVNSLVDLAEKVNFQDVSSFDFTLEQQYKNIIEILEFNKKDLAVYTYFDNDITVLKTFLINDE